MNDTPTADNILAGTTVLDIYERISDGVFALDTDWRFTYVNPRAEDILQRSTEDLIGANIWDEFPEAVEEAFFEEYHLAMETQEPASFKGFHEPLQTWFRVRGYPSENGITILLADVTEDRERARLEQLNERLRLLNRIIRHDIRNDMNVAMGWSQELAPHVDEAGQPILGRVQSTHRHVVDLTMVARDFVNALGTDEEITPEPTDVRTFLEKEIDKRRELYPEAEFTLRDEIPPVTVAANELLSCVFRNILNNAVQHNDKENPQVEIGVAVESETVRVSISDSGPGIPDTQKEAIFGIAEEMLGDPEVGIGLYLVNTLVTSYGGDVWVEDNHPEGSVFIVELRRM